LVLETGVEGLVWARQRPQDLPTSHHIWLSCEPAASSNLAHLGMFGQVPLAELKCPVMVEEGGDMACGPQVQGNCLALGDFARFQACLLPQASTWGSG
jgi:hypothetical protein